MKMIHPDVEAIADVVSHTVYHAVWAPRGWKLLGDAEAFASEVLGKPVKKLDDLKVDELKALVSARGGEYPATTAKKADVTKTFLDSFGEPAAPPAEPESPALAVADADTSADTTDVDTTDADTTSSAPADTNQKGK